MTVDTHGLQDGNSCSIAILHQLSPTNWHPWAMNCADELLVEELDGGCPLGEIDFADR
jgi:hypothetical protein